MAASPTSPAPDAVKPPPRNLDAERTVLGSGLIDNTVLNVLQDMLTPEQLHPAEHQEIYRVMLALHNEQPPAPVDIVSVANYLSAAGSLDACGGAGYLASFEGYVLTTSNVGWYAEKILDTWRQRERMRLGQEIIEASQGGDSARAVQIAGDLGALDASDGTDAAAGPVSAADAVYGAVDLLERKIAGTEEIGLDTGWPLFDWMVAGFQPGNLIIISGKSSSGKTAFLYSMVKRWCQRGIPGAIFSLEMNAIEISNRFLCMLTGIPYRDIQRGKRVDQHGDYRPFTRDEMSAIVGAQGLISEWPLYIDATSGLRDSQLFARARILHEKHRLAWLGLDYMQLVEVTTMNKSENREQQLARLSRQYKALGGELGIPAIGLSQLNDDGKTRESRALHNDADVHLTSGLSVDDKGLPMKHPEDHKQCNIYQNKGRNLGRASIKFNFHGAGMEFVEAPRG